MSPSPHMQHNMGQNESVLTNASEKPPAQTQSWVPNLCMLSTHSCTMSLFLPIHSAISKLRGTIAMTPAKDKCQHSNLSHNEVIFVVVICNFVLMVPFCGVLWWWSAICGDGSLVVMYCGVISSFMLMVPLLCWLDWQMFSTPWPSTMAKEHCSWFLVSWVAWFCGLSPHWSHTQGTTLKLRHSSLHCNISNV